MRSTYVYPFRQLTFLPAILPVNCYLVEEQDGLTLIDAALPYCAKPIAAAARQMGKPIRRILLTHAHNDHIGALVALKQADPAIQVLMPAREAALLEDVFTLLPDEPDAPLKGGWPKGLRIKPDRLLTDGEQVGSLQAIHAPGHTPGSMAYLDNRSGTLFAGDAFQYAGGIAVAGDLRWRFPFPALATWHPPTALQSAKKLLALEPKLLAAGHGKLLTTPVPLLQQAVARAEKRFPPLPLPMPMSVVTRDKEEPHA